MPDPVITTHLFDTGFAVGTSMVLTVVAENADTYTWQRTIGGGEPEVLSETTNTLTINPCDGGDEGNYLCTVSHSVNPGSAFTACSVVCRVPRTVEVVQTITPSMSLCLDPLPGQPRFHPGDGYSPTVTGIGRFRYRWKKDDVLISDGVKYANTSGLAESPADVHLQINNPELSDQDTYQLEVVDFAFYGWDYANLITSDNVTLLVDQQAPVITLQPQGVTVDVPNPWEFTVEACTGGSATYQWQRDNAPWANIAGATASSYASQGDSAEADSGDYRCQVTNDITTTVTDEVTLLVNADPADPPNKQLGGNRMTFGSLHGSRGMIIGESIHDST